MSLANILSGLQTELRAMATFASADVTVNDLSVLDGPTVSAPYFVLWTPERFNLGQDTSVAQNDYEVEGWLIEPWADDWDATIDQFTTSIDAIGAHFITGDSRVAGGLTGTNVRNIRGEGRINIFNSTYAHQPEGTVQPFPAFVAQVMVFEVEEF